MKRALREAWHSVREAMRNPGIRRLELGWMLSIAADAALTVLLLVEAYHRSGAFSVGLLGALRMLPAVAAASAVGSLLGRVRVKRLIVALSLARAAIAIGTAVVVATGAPTPFLFLLAALAGAAGAPIRPAEALLIPALSRTPAELVAANVAWGTVEGLGTLVGPVIAGVLLGTPAAWAVAVVAALGFIAVAVAVGGIRLEHAADEGGGRSPSGLRFSDGLRTLARRAAPRWAIVAVFGQTMTRGLLNTLIVIASVELLGMGEAGVGTLNGALGVGGLVGAATAMSLVSSTRLIRGLAASLAYWGLPIAVIALYPTPAVALLAMAAVGVANALFDVALFTVFHRGSTNEERGGVFTVFETVAGLGVVAGSLLGPELLTAFGTTGALVVAGGIGPVLAVVIYARVGRLERVTVVDDPTVHLLREVPAFATLPLTAVERLAVGLVHEVFSAGTVLMREGEPGNEFLVIAAGEVEVSVAGRTIHRLGRGAGVGEIALLRRLPRTATVMAVTEVRALGVSRDQFLAALIGPNAAAAMERSAAANLSRSASVPT